ncbi:MAG: glycosyltransferase family 2 protein [Candidatus Caldarchaeales archaeon]
MPTVSVVIPAYNEERHIKRCVESLLAQSFDDIEVIVVNNGSRDRTAQVVEELAREHPGKVRLIRLFRNLGPGGGRNIGALHADGEILVFVDADMSFPPDYIGKMVEPIRRGEALMTTHLTEYVANFENPWVKVQGQTVKGSKGGFSTIVRAIRKDFFLKNGGFDPSLHYHDDRTFYYKTGITPLAVKDAYCYHNNPDTIVEIFRRNYWIGRTFFAVMYHENGIKGVIRASAITLSRLLDLIALPSAVACIAHQPLPLILTVLLLTPLVIFTALMLRMRIIGAESALERLKLRLIYAPAYRIVRGTGLIAGVLVSLLRGLRVKPQTPPSQVLPEQ